MTSERIQRRIDSLLDEADEAIARLDWAAVRDRANAVLAANPENADGRAYLEMAQRGLLESSTASSPSAGPPSASRPEAQPTSFANGRYTVKRFLGEGGKKKVYLAHDASLDRDVAFALIKTDGLDTAARERITREAQAMGRLGAHPHIVTVFDIGEEAGQPYLVLPVLGGGDVEGIIEKAPEHKMPIDQAIKIATETCLGLEFAHGKGIIHRDIKPGNVWLTEDGRTMVGDFGLAVATDRSRLTQAGMMVGTVSYMPPEQAMGGEITPRSDLYALGAMLYEMVCGRPPFVGDESVAIIGQHLNTPPVAPSWHRPDCPSALEALILRLLEKDPSKRPDAASDVRQALESVASAPKAPSLQQPVDSPHTHSALYTRTFVGRDVELRALEAAFDASLSGQGSLAMVVGEPGIGKTALCEQLATYVAMRGGKALAGHCYEEGSLSLPYLPFVEAMRSYVLAREPDGLHSDLGTGAADVARIVSEVRDRVQVELRPAGDPEDDRWRLLQAITLFLRQASTVQPLMILLEDLHWADRGTLDLLLHLARNLSGTRLLIVGTYRDVEVDRSHLLSGVLADLRRLEYFQRVPLRGLTVDEVKRMMTNIRGQDVSMARAEAVYRQTEGNPLFVQEVLRYLVEEGYVIREDGRFVPTYDTTDPNAGIPEGLRDVIGKRLSHLGEKTNQVLSIAAVVGREFRFDLLLRVSGLPEEEVEAAIKEAEERAVLEQRSSVGVLNFRFTHAFFRQILYEEIFASQRLRLHQQVARGLESIYTRRLEEHASELAEHFSQSTDHADLEKALSYSELAANRAMSVFAYSEAVQHIQQALKIQDVLNPDDNLRRCDLLLSLGDAMLPMEGPRQVADTVAEEAFQLAETLGDSQRAARAAVQAVDAFQRMGGEGVTPVMRTPEFRQWTIRADHHARQGTAERVYADLGLFGYTNVTAGPALSHVFLRHAVETALGLQDTGPFFAAASRAGGGMTSLVDRELIERVIREGLSKSHEGVAARDLGVWLSRIAPAVLSRGNRAVAEDMWQELEQLAERSRDATRSVTAMMGPISIAILDGRLEESLSLSDAHLIRATELGMSRQSVHRPLIWLGRAADYLGSFEDSGRPSQSRRSVLLAHLGRLDEARAIRATFGDIGATEDESGLHVLVDMLEVSTITRDDETTRSLSGRLAPLANEGWFGSEGGASGTAVSIGRLLGGGAMLLREPDQARIYYNQGLEYCAKIRFRPEIALIQLELAELFLEHYPDEHDAAIEHLDFAIAELRDMKMQPALERALRHRGLLKA